MVIVSTDSIYGEVFINLESNHSDEYSLLSFIGSREAVHFVSNALSMATGLYGHLIGDFTTPSDLYVALFRESGILGVFGPVILEGQNLMKQPPKGSSGIDFINT